MGTKKMGRRAYERQKQMMYTGLATRLAGMFLQAGDIVSSSSASPLCDQRTLLIAETGL